jgi:hypothetical protein
MLAWVPEAVLGNGLALALVLSVLTLVTAAAGLSVASVGKEALANKEVEVARRLAETAVAEAFVVLTRGSGSPPESPGMVCVSSSPCSAASPDYVGCYTYRYDGTPDPAWSSCTPPGPITGSGGEGVIWALGVTKNGMAFQLRAEVRSWGIYTWWEPLR